MSAPDTSPDRHTIDPPPPCAPYFDPARNGWVLSRYCDVLAAFREPRLQQVPASTKLPKPLGQARLDASAAISHLRLNQMRDHMTELIHPLIRSLRPDRKTDLVSELIRPWSIAILLAVLGQQGEEGQHCAAVANHLFGGPADTRRAFLRARLPTAAVLRALPEYVWLTARQKRAERHLNHLSAKIHLPGLRSVFLGVSQTLPGFLANAWLDLLSHPDVMQRLRTEPALLPGAIEELLRHAGLVHTLIRHASDDIRIAGIDIKSRQSVILKVASANHDPEQFPEPNRLVIDRRIDHREMSHLALGSGTHSCVGVQLVRTAAIIATEALLEGLPHRMLAGPVEWVRGPVLSFPRSLRVLARSIENQPRLQSKSSS
jgi:cytochrome P450